MKSRKRDTSKKRDSLLNAAIKAFQEIGYYNCSMDKIAEIANASKRTLYNHFPSKDILFQAVISRFLEEQSKLKEIVYRSDRSIESQLSAFIDSELFLINTPDRLGLSKVLTSVFLREPELAYAARERFGPPLEKLTKWIEDASNDKKLSVTDPGLCARMFYSIYTGTLTYPALFSGCMPEDEVIRLKNEVIEIFLARYRTIWYFGFHFLIN